jgi:site-specific DNA-methyltransferase (adenine-specific)
MNLLDLRRADCMDVMREFPDAHFDLAIVDPPYGISAPRMGMATDFRNGSYTPGRGRNRLHAGAGKLKDRALQRLSSDWDARPPGPEYFAELRRVSKHQIIWGGNYFPLPPTRCVICWDKEQPWENFSQWEMAWTSFDRPAAMFRQQNGSQAPNKIHPTQKPVKLYDWLLAKFAKPGQRILDTHLGSGSIAIACHYARCPLVACEIDPDYFAAATARIEKETAQLDFYESAPSLL